MKEYRFRISGVHYAANPEAETKRLPDTEEMHVRTCELLRKIDRERPLVSLFAEPSNLFNPDCIMAFSRGNRIGRVADECVGEVKSLLAQSEDPILFARIEDVTIRQHGHLTVVVEAEELTDILPLQTSAIEWDIVLSRLYYMNTPRKALDAILTLLMLRELTCRQLDIEMKPMIESEYGSDKVVEECGETYTESPIYLSTAKGQKIDLIRVLNVMYEQGRFTGKDGSKLTKKEFFIEAGRTFHVDLSSYDKDLSRSMSDSTKLEKHLKPFEDMKLKMIEIWNSK